ALCRAAAVGGLVVQHRGDVGAAVGRLAARAPPAGNGQDRQLPPRYWLAGAARSSFFPGVAGGGGRRPPLSAPGSVVPRAAPRPARRDTPARVGGPPSPGGWKWVCACRRSGPPCSGGRATAPILSTSRACWSAGSTT